ncbi:diaminopimelate decarboxylase [Streptomyces sp. SID161]|uniref:diaminopimelate decarboxylase n=1 Tax=Streptomyces sp. SID161 TaxID=2690251 RepID=UPI00136DD590|nr:diaminopimelate decarboxylase [Streptomyces sp. SID161]MYW49726.1 diaminopimelate decarboxylase [Streptomyces sp. SID161]
MTAVAPAAARRERILQEAVRQRLLDPEQSLLAGFVDLDGVAATARALHDAFPRSPEVPGALHTFAAKANCLVPVLRELRRQGLGCEVATAGELARARAAGFPAGRIVFDAPAKTRAELERALALGVTVNADSFQELERISRLLGERASRSRIGVRLNCQVGGGAIAAMSTATSTSKFGVPLTDPGNRERLLRAFGEHPWLTWVHTHTGSQGCPLDLMARGVAQAVDFADQVTAAFGEGRIAGIDIGGGLPVNFADDEVTPTFATYVEQLRAHAPGLFDGRYAVVTEFGRSLLAKNGFMAAYVEYTKTAGGRPIAVTHAGVQVATRTVFGPDAWPLRIEAYDPNGTARRDRPVRQDIAGPACFAGDLLARDRALPPLRPGDLVVVPDTGAYYFSTPFHYNSLPEPAVYGVRTGADGQTAFTLIRPAQDPWHLTERDGVNVLPEDPVPAGAGDAR